jgi:hypothetical protein
VGIGFVGVPVLRDLLADDLDVVGVTITEGAVLDGGGGGAVFELGDGFGELLCGLAGGGLGGGVGCGCLGGAGCVMGPSLAGCGLALTRMSVSRGGGMVASLGGGWGAGLMLSGVRTDLSTGLNFCGRGMAETMEAWMAPTDKAFSPQWLEV